MADSNAKRQGHERYARAILLLVEGGLFVAKEVLSREAQRSGSNLDEILKQHEGQLSIRFNKGQCADLFPMSGNVKLEDLDLALLTGVLLEVFRTSLSSKEKRDILVLRNVREELMLHIRNVSLDEEIYTDLSNQLKEALQSLATGLEPAVQDNCRRFIARYNRGPVHMNSSLDHLDEMCEFDEAFETVATQLRREIKTVVDEIIKIVKKAEDEGRSLKKPKVFIYELKTFCENEEINRQVKVVIKDVINASNSEHEDMKSRKEAPDGKEEDSTVTGFAQAQSEGSDNLANEKLVMNKQENMDNLANVQTPEEVDNANNAEDSDLANNNNALAAANIDGQDEPHITEHGSELLDNTNNENRLEMETDNSCCMYPKVKQHFDDIAEAIQGIGDVKVTVDFSNDIVIKIECVKLNDVIEVLSLMDSTNLQTQLAGLANALNEALNTEEILYVVCDFVEENMQQNLKSIKAENVEYSRSINLSMQANTVEGLIHIWDMFEGGKAQNDLNKVAEALSDYLGSKITLHVSLDKEKFKAALDEAVAQIVGIDKEQKSEQSERASTESTTGTVAKVENEQATQGTEDKTAGTEAEAVTPRRSRRSVEIVSVKSGTRKKTLFDETIDDDDDSEKEESKNGETKEVEKAQITQKELEAATPDNVETEKTSGICKEIDLSGPSSSETGRSVQLPGEVPEAVVDSLAKFYYDIMFLGTGTGSSDQQNDAGAYGNAVAVEQTPKIVEIEDNNSNNSGNELNNNGENKSNIERGTENDINREHENKDDLDSERTEDKLNEEKVNLAVENTGLTESDKTVDHERKQEIKDVHIPQNENEYEVSLQDDNISSSTPDIIARSSIEDIRLSRQVCQVFETAGITDEVMALRVKEIDASKCKQSQVAKDAGRSIIICHFGSHAEGTNLADVPSQLDICVILNDVTVVKYTSHSGSSENIVIGEDTRPGYMKLLLTDSLKERIVKETEYLRSDALLSKELGLAGGAHIGQGGFGSKIILGIQFKDWPADFSQTLQRRARFWSFDVTIDQLAKEPLVVVPHGNFDNKNSDMEWRICTTFLEKVLINQMNIHQKRTLILFKLVLQTLVNPHLSKPLSSFVIKTIFLHTVEHIWPELRSSENLILCLLGCLSKTRVFLKANFIPNFFIPKDNLIQDMLTSEDRQKAVKLLLELGSDPYSSITAIQVSSIGRLLKTQCSGLETEKPVGENTFEVNQSKDNANDK